MKFFISHHVIHSKCCLKWHRCLEPNPLRRFGVTRRLPPTQKEAESIWEQQTCLWGGCGNGEGRCGSSGFPRSQRARVEWVISYLFLLHWPQLGGPGWCPQAAGTLCFWQRLKVAGRTEGREEKLGSCLLSCELRREA